MAKERSSFFDSFNSEFEKQLPSTKNNCQAAFEAASNAFREKVGSSPYGSWDSFKSRRSQEIKRKRTA